MGGRAADSLNTRVEYFKIVWRVLIFNYLKSCLETKFGTAQSDEALR